MLKVYTTEQKKLEQLYREDKNNITLLYGNIDSGKASFIKNFLSDKEYFYYDARNISPKEQKKIFIKEFNDYFHINIGECDYQELLNKIRFYPRNKMIIVLDNFQNMIKEQKEFLDFIVTLYEGDIFKNRVMFLLSVSGTVKVFNEKEFINHKIFKEIDEKIKLSYVSFLEMVRTFPKFSVIDAVATYSIIGGAYSYIEKWDENLSTKDNIIKLLLNKDGPLRDEAERFLHQELRELLSYNTILYSIAKGNHKLNDIFKDTEFSRAKILVYLKNLMEFDVVKKIVSFDSGGWDNAKKGIYRISNNFLNFYFTFIYPNLSKLNIMKEDKFYDKYIKDNLYDFMKQTFVKVCGEYIFLMNMMGKMPIKIEKMGTWIGKNGTIDIVCQNDIRENVIVSCHWEDNKMQKEAYDKLILLSKEARLKPKSVYLFSTTDFSDELKNLSKDKKNELYLIDMKEL